MSPPAYKNMGLGSALLSYFGMLSYCLKLFLLSRLATLKRKIPCNKKALREYPRK